MMTIDVVITSYNRVNVVGSAIDSALRALPTEQGRVIVVDDASSDNTVAFLKSRYSEAIATGRMAVVVHKKNKGVTGAKNSGFTHSGADWVVFLDSDDQLIYEEFRKVAGYLSQHPQAPLALFRCINQAGEFVGQAFEDVQLLDLRRFLEHTSYGEVLVAANKKMIGNAFYDEDLRGYEGLGCARVIKEQGAAHLTPIIARRYDQSGDDRLSSPQVLLTRAASLLRGHSRMFREFGWDMPMRSRMKMIVKIIVYAMLAGLNALSLKLRKAAG